MTIIRVENAFLVHYLTNLQWYTCLKCQPGIKMSCQTEIVSFFFIRYFLAPGLPACIRFSECAFGLSMIWTCSANSDTAYYQAKRYHVCLVETTDVFIFMTRFHIDTLGNRRGSIVLEVIGVNGLFKPWWWCSWRDGLQPRQGPKQPNRKALLWPWTRKRQSRQTVQSWS